MKWSRRAKVAVAFAVLMLTGVAAVYYASQTYSYDKYAGQPQVVRLPSGYDPMAPARPYAGAHPALSDRPADDYEYPIPPGGTGPVRPTYLDNLQYPFACRSEKSGLGQPLVDNHEGVGTAVYVIDENGDKTKRIAGYSRDCSIPTRVNYYYLEAGSEQWLPLVGEPRDAAMVQVGATHVPFVVRLETGTINRHIYLIATLRGPRDTAQRPDLSHWNDKLVFKLRGGVGIGRRQGRIDPTYILYWGQAQLEQGYAVAHSTANQTATQYDIQLAEDTLARLKRHFIARYEEPLHTIGIGKSGGAIQLYLIGQNRPGLIDAAIAQFSYPDMITQTIKVMDCELLEYFFDVIDGDNPKWRKWSQRRWILGFNARDDMPNIFEGFGALIDLRNGRWPDIERGHTECTRSWRSLTPQIANPNYTFFVSLYAPDIVSRVPWTYWDNLKRVYGTDEHGYARRTWDNVGVQYGLGALKSGKITIDEFLHLNASIGGWKPAAEMTDERFWVFAGGRSELAEFSVWSDHNMVNGGSEDQPARRSVADPDAVAAAYRSGQVFLGRLSMPVIDVRHYLEPQLNMHHSMQSFSARLRMQREQGHADNQLVWFVEPPAAPVADAIELTERWLENIKRSRGDAAAARPADADDRCYDSSGSIIARGPGVWDGVWNGKADGQCMQRFPIYSNPRIVAGDSYVGDIFKCHLQPVAEAVDRGVYAPFDIGPYLHRVEKVFPNGVCDYSRGDAARPPGLLAKKK